jgi:hypothetical protein
MTMSKWHENKWQDKADVVVSETQAALQTVYDALNQGQQKKLLKDEGVKELFDRYGVAYTE